MMTYLEPQKEIDVYDDVDVIVVGGGPAGSSAALAAGRMGAKTLLIERFGCLGGVQSLGVAPLFMFPDPEVHGGIMKEILKRLEDGGATTKAKHLPKVDENSMIQKALLAMKVRDKLPKRMYESAGFWGQLGRAFDAEYYKLMLDEMMQEAEVKLMYHTFAAGVIREDDMLKGVVIESSEGRKAVMGKVVIDTTGMGDISRKSGAAIMGDEGFPVGNRKGRHVGMMIGYYIGGVNHEKFNAFCKENPEDWGAFFKGAAFVKQGIREGYHVRDMGIVLYNISDGRTWIQHAAYGLKGGRGYEIREQTSAEIEIRKQMYGLQKLFKDKIPGFESSYVQKAAILPLNGDPCRMLGEYVMTVADMRAGRIFEDSIGIANMPPDTFEMLGRMDFDILPYDIPYRCLISRDINNLMAAGTTMSSGGVSVCAMRFSAPSLAQGQGAGTAAAMSVKQGVSPKQVDIKALQDNLRRQGVYISVKERPDEAIEPYRAIQQLTMMGGKHEFFEDMNKY
ncbi:MAG: FAD-dependent oxidoreductase [Deltaproteobacteria bacterium]|nr:FAD-dependent oxidoreductase [Deltaproteobacteria bacterium]